MLENLNTRISIILLVIAASWYFLIPTIRLYNNPDLSSEAKQLLEKDSINLGLDLKGGLRIVLELDDFVFLNNKVSSGLRQSSKNEAEVFLTECMTHAKEENIDIFNAISNISDINQIKLNKYFSNISKSSNNDDIISLMKESRLLTMESIEDKMRKRISQHDQYGLGEPTIQRVGEKRLIVELAGITDLQNAKDYIQQTAEFEISLVKKLNALAFINGLESVDEYFIDQGITFTDFLIREKISSYEELEKLFKNELDIINAQLESQNKNIQESPFANKEQFHDLITIQDYLENLEFNDFFIDNFESDQLQSVIFFNNKYIEILSQFLNHKIIKNKFSSSSKFLFSNKIIFKKGSIEYKQLYEVNAKPAIKNNMIENTKAVIGEIGSEYAGRWLVNLGMKDIGERAWYKFTAANVENQAAIILDNEVYFAPYIKQAIKGGNTQISGFDDMQEAKNIASVLRAGELDAPIHAVQTSFIGPSLGQESIASGSKAMLVGLLLVFIFMLFYYKGAGLIANIALLLNLIFVLSVLVTLNAILTLPGIAGLLLTVGMTVDANVIIFERIKEELSRGLKGYKALHAGYDKAFLTILDANVTTLLTAFVLSFIGSGSIKGFATTLSVGIICSMFTAVFVTKTIFLIFPKLSDKLGN